MASPGCVDENGPPPSSTCFVGDDAGTAAETLVASPALECGSRLCLHVEQTGPDLCTATCEQDDDCGGLSSTACETGFACVTPIGSGSYACERLCVCRQYLPALAPVVCGDAGT